MMSVAGAHCSSPRLSLDGMGPYGSGAIRAILRRWLPPLRNLGQTELVINRRMVRALIPFSKKGALKLFSDWIRTKIVKPLDALSDAESTTASAFFSGAVCGPSKRPRV